jgi:hypothetical protein
MFGLKRRKKVPQGCPLCQSTNAPNTIYHLVTGKPFASRCLDCKKQILWQDPIVEARSVMNEFIKQPGTWYDINTVNGVTPMVYA